MLGDLQTVAKTTIVLDGSNTGDGGMVVEDDFITYARKDDSLNRVTSSFWFDKNNTIKWYDVYYERQ